MKWAIHWYGCLCSYNLQLVIASGIAIAVAEVAIVNRPLTTLTMFLPLVIRHSSSGVLLSPPPEVQGGDSEDCAALSVQLYSCLA